MTRNESNNLYPNTAQKLAESSELRNKHNSHIILGSESEYETAQQNNNSNNNSTIETSRRNQSVKH